MIIGLPAKDPNETLDYSWKPSLADGDSITALAASVISGDATIQSESFTATAAKFFLTGGTTSTVVELRATTLAGVTLEASFEIPIKTSAGLTAVSASELRSWLRGVSDPDEALIELIEAATEHFEDWAGISLLEKTITEKLDSWPMSGDRGSHMGDVEAPVSILAAQAIELPIGPLMSVESIKTYDAANAPTTFADTNYFVETSGQLGVVSVNAGVTWPIPGRLVSGIEIIYKAGFGSLPSDVPGSLKVGIKQLAAHYYENREAVGEMGLSEAPVGIKNLVRRYRVRPGVA